MDKFQVKIDESKLGEVDTLPDEKWLFDSAKEAGWSEDPGTGTAVLLPDAEGRGSHEVFNPIPVAPPIGWEATPPIDQLIRDRVRAEVSRLQDDQEIDDIVDAEDFDIPEELPELSTIYEFIGMATEAPGTQHPVTVTPADRIKDELDYEELKDKERKLRQRRSREEYERRRKEERELYGDDPPAVK